MAFSQKQKEQLMEMMESPKMFLESIKSNKININSFKDEFFREGDGIFHFILSGIIDANAEKRKEFMELFHYVVDNSDISLFQYTGRKFDAVNDILFNKDKELNDESAVFLLEIAKKVKSRQKNYIKNRSWGFSSGEVRQEDLDRTAEDIVEKTIKKSSLKSKDLIDFIKETNIVSKAIIKLLIVSIIEKNDLNSLIYAVDSLGLTKNDLDKIIKSFRINSYSYDTNSYGVLAYAAKTKSFDCFSYLWNNNLADKMGDVNENKYGNSKNVKAVINPMFELIRERDESKKDFIINHFKNLNPKEKLKIISISYYSGIKKDGAISDFILMGLHDLMIESINEIIKSDEIETIRKINFVADCIDSFTENIKDLSKINDFVGKIEINPNNEWIKSAKSWQYGGLNIFNLSWRESLILNKKEEVDYVEIIKKLNKFNLLNCVRKEKENGIFNKLFFYNKNIIKDILNEIEFINKTTEPSGKVKQINIFKFGFEEINEKKENSTIVKVLNDAFLEIKKTNKSLLFDKIESGCLVNFAIKNDNDFWLNLISDNDLKKFIKSNLINKEGLCSSYNDIGKNYEKWINRLIDCDMVFNDTKENFYSIFNNVEDENILKKIIKKENINLDEIFNNTLFWKQIKNDIASENIKKLKDEYQIEIKNKEILLELTERDARSSVDIFLDFTPDVCIMDSDNNDNALHIAIKDKNYELADVLLNKAPILAKKENKSGKLPINYLFVAMAKECEILNTTPNPSDKVKNVFEKALKAGVSKNEKAIKQLNKYFENYPIILNKYPDLGNLFLKKTIEEKLELNNKVVKKNKI